MDIVLRNVEHISRLAENPLNQFPLPEIYTGQANRVFKVGWSHLTFNRPFLVLRTRPHILCPTALAESSGLVLGNGF